MNAQKLTETLIVLVQNRMKALIVGQPGIGKTDIVGQVADFLKCKLITMFPAVSDPTTFEGMPSIDPKSGLADFLPFGQLRQIMTATELTIVFLDDLGQAPPAVQAAVMHLLLAREINGKKVSDNVVFLAATNRRGDGAGVKGILEPVKSRFSMIIQYTPDVKSYTAWAQSHGVAHEYIAWVNFQPEVLTAWSPTSDIVNQPSPRTITEAAKLWSLGLRDLESQGDAMGESHAGQFLAFTKVYKDLPSLSGIIADPQNAIVPRPEAISATHAVTQGLVHKASLENAESIVTYSMRLAEEFDTVLVQGMINKFAAESEETLKAFQETQSFVKWSVKHQHIAL